MKRATITEMETQRSDDVDRLLARLEPVVPPAGLGDAIWTRLQRERRYAWLWALGYLVALMLVAVGGLLVGWGAEGALTVVRSTSWDALARAPLQHLLALLESMPWVSVSGAAAGLIAAFLCARRWVVAQPTSQGLLRGGSMLTAAAMLAAMLLVGGVSGPPESVQAASLPAGVVEPAFQTPRHSVTGFVVRAVEGGLQVRDRRGNVHSVVLRPDTAVRANGRSQPANLATGDWITIIGQPEASGMQASLVNVVAPGPARIDNLRLLTFLPPQPRGDELAMLAAGLREGDVVVSAPAGDGSRQGGRPSGPGSELAQALRQAGSRASVALAVANAEQARRLALVVAPEVQTVVLVDRRAGAESGQPRLDDAQLRQAAAAVHLANRRLFLAREYEAGADYRGYEGVVDGLILYVDPIRSGVKVNELRGTMEQMARSKPPGTALFVGVLTPRGQPEALVAIARGLATVPGIDGIAIPALRNQLEAIELVLAAR
ncbi:MAG: hypothetical protein HY329_17420 [Chloroflexi bacterium]|nr:hypothetical protein [Chloroflexota bacterium]